MADKPQCDGCGLQRWPTEIVRGFTFREVGTETQLADTLLEGAFSDPGTWASGRPGVGPRRHTRAPGEMVHGTKRQWSAKLADGSVLETEAMQSVVWRDGDVSSEFRFPDSRVWEHGEQVCIQCRDHQVGLAQARLKMSSRALMRLRQSTLRDAEADAE